eukprot:gene31611-41045_t
MILRGNTMEDNATKQPKADTKENVELISTKPVRRKKESAPAAIENSQEDVPIYSRVDVSISEKVLEQSIIPEVDDIKPPKKAKKSNSESVVVSPSSTSTTSKGGDDDLESFLEEGSKYIAEHSADKIREQLLEEYDVEIFDRNGIWQTRDKSISRPLKGFSASYADKVQPAKPIKCILSAAEIQKLVEQRTRHRRARKFDLADQIRDQLAEGGVEVMDKSNEWRSFDGTLGGLQSEDFGSYR